MAFVGTRGKGQRVGNVSARRAAALVARVVRRRAVLCAAAAAALVTMALVPPDAAYAGYVDLRTIACLFCVLGVAGALKRAGAFSAAARAVVRRFSKPRTAVLALVLATAVLSMFATNDLALIMMLPLASATLVRAGWSRLVPFAFTVMSLSANLGGMIMPFGNPQNLYLYSFYEIGLSEFLAAMAVPFAVSMALVVACCLVGARAGALRGSADGASRTGGASDGDAPLDGRRIACYVVLLCVSVATVVRVVPAPIAVAIVLVALAVLDRGALRGVDYALMATFVCFFVFAGNMARIPAVNEALGGLMASFPLLTSAGLSQIISNVPAAVLLSHFTDAWQPLLVGVNIGGAGTPVGSLASLITIQHFLVVRRHTAVREAGAGGIGRFMAMFVGSNLAFLAVLCIVCLAAG